MGRGRDLFTVVGVMLSELIEMRTCDNVDLRGKGCRVNSTTSRHSGGRIEGGRVLMKNCFVVRENRSRNSNWLLFHTTASPLAWVFAAKEVAPLPRKLLLR